MSFRKGKESKENMILLQLWENYSLRPKTRSLGKFCGEQGKWQKTLKPLADND
jgi:hypothetical protein